MNVLLTIWISAVLIQEVIPNTLVRQPREGENKPSIVQTEYEAKYEQKGRHGNESCGRVTGKHEIVHDNCGDNWNSFADKCASLIKDLVASLANAVSSKPGDATNLQVKIKNTFRHFDNTHNCTCLNHTGKKLSDIDLSPIFKNLSQSTASPEDHYECGKESQGCGIDDSEMKEGEGSENGSKTNDQSAGQSCRGQNDSSKTGKSCKTGADVTEAPGKRKQQNCELVEDDSQVNLETAEGSEDQLNNNCRRQVIHPKFSTMKPQTKSTSNTDPSYSSSNSISYSKLPDNEKTSVTSTPAPDLSEQPKSPLIAPNSSLSKSTNPAADSSISSSSNSRTPPSSDSQFSASPNNGSASQTVKPYESSTNQKDPKITTKPIPQEESEKATQETNQAFFTISPVPSQHKATVITPVTVKQSSGSSGGSAHDDSEQYSSTSPIPSKPKATVITPVTVKQSSGSSGGSAHDDSEQYSSTSPIPSKPKATVITPVTVKQSSGSSGGSAHDDSEQYSSTSPIPSKPKATVTTPVTVKQSSGSSGGSAHDDSEQYSSTSPIPSQHKATVIIPVTVTHDSDDEGCDSSSLTTPVSQPPESEDKKQSTESNKDKKDSISTTAVSNQSQTIVPITTKHSIEGTHDSGDEDHDSSSLTIPVSQPSEYEGNKQSIESSKNKKGYTSTTALPDQFKTTIPVTTKQPNGSATSSGSGDQKPSSSNTLAPFFYLPKESTVNADNRGDELSSSTPAVEIYSATPSAADAQVINLGTSKKPIPRKYYSGPYIASQQERPTTYASTASPQDDSEGESQYPKTTSPTKGSPVTVIPTKSQQKSTAAPVIVKPSQPGALIPNDNKNQDSGSLQPTTFQTTSIEPTTPNAYLPLSKNTKSYPVTTSLPTDPHKTLPMKPSTSPKTTETQDDDDEDDEEDCCSCESCTEEEITDPKLYKENACKNLEEARRELKAIFNKIKKKLNCGRKAPQPIIT